MWNSIVHEAHPVRRIRVRFTFEGFLIVTKFVAAVLLTLHAIAPAHAQPGPSDYGFTAAQAAGGKAIYVAKCASCHGMKLEGQSGPALAGPAFDMRWMRGGRSYGDFNHAIRDMPKGSPDSLPARDYDALAAYLLSANDFGASDASMSGDPRTMLIAPTSHSGGNTAGHVQLIDTKSLPAKPERVASAQTAAPSDAELRAPADADWLMANRNYAGDRFSNLTQIDRSNALNLRPVCVLSLGVLGSFQGSPLIYKGVGFIASTYGVYAFDAATCERLWTFTYTPTGPEGIPTSRGIALYEGKLFRGTSDGHLIALDMKSGSLLWDAHVADGALSYSIGAAPIVFEGRVIVGLAGGDYGNIGHVYAFDARTGEKRWTFDLIDAKTWSKGADSGGGGSWTTVAVDPERRLVFIPVGNPSPDYYLAARPGKNLYTNSVVVLDTNTGKLAWYVQQLAEDFHDWDTSAAPILYDQDSHRYMAVGTKAGYLYIYDRDTHLLVSRANVVPRLNDTLPLTDQPLRVCPGTAAGVEWNGPAYDRETRSLFVNSVHWCSTWSAKPPEGKKPGSWYVEADVRMDPPELMKGWTHAIDAVTGKELWAREAPKPMIGAVTATAGGVVLTGGGDGIFLALDQRDGSVLYRFNTGGAIGGGVSTYRVDDRQYVAVAAGGYGLSSYGVAGAPAVLVFALPSLTNP